MLLRISIIVSCMLALSLALYAQTADPPTTPTVPPANQATKAPATTQSATAVQPAAPAQKPDTAKPAATDAAPASSTTESSAKPAPAQPPAQPVALTDTKTPAGPVAGVSDNGTHHKPGPDTQVSMLFNKADINNVVTFLSVASETPIVSDADLKGTVTIVSMKSIPLSLAYQVVNSALRARGYTMVGTLESDVIRVVPLKKAVAEKQLVETGTKIDAMVPNDDLVTQIIPLQFVSANRLKDNLKPLVSDEQASILAISDTNSLIVTDTAGNIRRLLQIINNLDQDTTDVVEVQIYKCSNASADNLVDTLSKTLLPKPTSGQPQQGGPPNGNGQPQQTVRSDEGLISLKGDIRVAADERTNSLIISATRPKIQLVMDMVKKLDIDVNPEVHPKVYQLTNADANLVATQLNKMFEQPQGSSTSFSPFFGGRGNQNQNQNNPASYAGLKRNMVVADVRTNSVIVTGTEQNLKTFDIMIKELDAQKALNEISRSYPLKYATATSVASSLTSLFQGTGTRQTNFFDLLLGNGSQNADGDPLAKLKNITVVADARSNALLITGPPQTFPMVEGLINQIDQRAVQVFIEVAIVDVTLNKDTQFGVEWNLFSQGKTNGEPNQSFGTDLGPMPTPAGAPAGLTYNLINKNLKVLLQAIESKNNVKVYSTPTITVSDNVQAMISIGEQDPYITSIQQSTSTSSTAPVQNIAFENAAVTLTVTPHVNVMSNVVAMDVDQTINEFTGTVAALQNAPIMATREAKTSLMVCDGQTIIIGGIIKNDKEEATVGVPILSSIPYLGYLFKKKNITNNRSELMVFITPHILRDEAGANAVTLQEHNQLSDHSPASNIK